MERKQCVATLEEARLYARSSPLPLSDEVRESIRNAVLALGGTAFVDVSHVSPDTFCAELERRRRPAGPVVQNLAVLAGFLLCGSVAAQLAAPAAFADLDTDRNGALSRIEAAAIPELLARFDALDRDGNGLVQPHEYAPGEPRSVTDVDARASAGASTPASAERLFSRLDRNGDGFLDDAELGAAAADRADWLAIDEDGDGRIAPREFRAIATR